MPQQRDAIFKALRKNELRGRDCARALSNAMDEHLRTMAENHISASHEFAFIATGGYGRGELCPASDIDLLFLTPKKTSRLLEESIERMLYTLWDSGIKVGHAVRNIGQCAATARDDTKAMTSLLDTRLIYGNAGLLEDLQDTLHKQMDKRAKKHFIKSKLLERDERHKRMGDTRYMLEPNIKEGKGGLRDYQTLLWLTEIMYEQKTLAGLNEIGVLTTREAERFRKSYDFLLTVRCHLHDLTQRAEERLHFDIQPALAERLGYANRDNAKAVERFMKHYFLVTRDIGDLTRIICAALEEELEGKQKPRALDEFVTINNRLSFPDDMDLKSNPLHIMNFFRAAQVNDIHIHPAALRRITRNLKLIDKDFVANKAANATFMDILCDEHNAAITLRRMNESGVLERFIPAFRKVIALMQFDRYHVFTVDEHTMGAIGIMHALRSGDIREEAPLASALIHDIADVQILFVAIMLHDICKGSGGDHSELGAELALTLCPRLGMSDHQTRMVSWLIYDHLFMADIAFKRDLDDPQTLEDFVFRVHDMERLKLLLILTTTDIMAVGPDRWNAWKDKLLQELYYLTEAHFTGGTPILSQHTASIWPQDLEPGETRIDFNQDEDKHATTVTVYTKDRDGLFATIAGALAASNTNIIEARINTLNDGRVIDVFTIHNRSGRQITNERRLNGISKNIMGALSRTLILKDAIAKAIETPSKKDMVFDIPGGVIIDENASKTQIMIEVFGRDRQGLLYDIASILKDSGLIIASAKINTLGLKAVDVFYVRKNTSKKNPTDLIALQLQLEKALN